MVGGLVIFISLLMDVMRILVMQMIRLHLELYVIIVQQMEHMVAQTVLVKCMHQLRVKVDTIQL